MRINLNKNDDWKKSLSPGYDTPRLHVRPLDPLVTDGMATLLSRNILYEFVPEIRDKSDALEWFKAVYRKSSYFFYTVNKTDHDGPDGSYDPAGFLMFNRNPDKRIFIGGCIDPCIWNQGVASELLQGLTLFVSEIRFIYPIYARVHPANTPVQKALKNAGFQPSDGSGVSDMLDYVLTPHP